MNVIRLLFSSLLFIFENCILQGNKVFYIFPYVLIIYRNLRLLIYTNIKHTTIYNNSFNNV